LTNFDEFVQKGTNLNPGKSIDRIFCQ